MLTRNSSKHAEHGSGGLTISASAITSVWQCYGVLTISVSPSHERAAGPRDSNFLSLFPDQERVAGPRVV
eukprot:4123193-Pyramimonas_sp.AAC.1